jgi:hypothetical protein
MKTREQLIEEIGDCLIGLGPTMTLTRAPAAIVDQLLLPAIRRAEKAEEEAAELDQAFDMLWDADMRGIEAWQAEHPGNDLVLPDRSEFATWLVCKWEAAEAALAQAKREAHNAALEKAAARLEEGQNKAYGAINEVLRVNAYAIRAMKEPTP